MTGREAGGKIWWHSWRIAHSVLYFAFAYAAITGDQNAYLYLATRRDTSIVSVLRSLRFRLYEVNKDSRQHLNIQSQ